MKSHYRAVFMRATLYSLLAGVASGVISLVIARLYGMNINGDTLRGSLITGAIAFVVALAFFSGFMLYFSRKYSREKA